MVRIFSAGVNHGRLPCKSTMFVCSDEMLVTLEHSSRLDFERKMVGISYPSFMNPIGYFDSC